MRGSTMNVTKIQIGLNTIKTRPCRKCFDRKIIENSCDFMETMIPSFLKCLRSWSTSTTHVCPCVTVRCRRAEVRDASVGLKSRKRLTLAPVRRGTRWGMQRGDDRLPLPSLFSLPISTTHATPVENATLNSHGSAASHRARLCAPIDPATTHFTSG